MPTRPTPPTRPTHLLRRARPRVRVRLLAAALAAAAALTLTACQDGEGLRDEGPSSSSTLKGSGALTRPGTLTAAALTGVDAYESGEAPARPHAEPPSGNS
ncbi:MULTISPECIES: hypothetical protein [unclassified Streptomyces]|uniref:hypothetical protein n=1 Tax=unclassified Streptomyces TaxID=2593676 RepID=UPI0033BF2BE5